TQEVVKLFDFPDTITSGVITTDRSALIISLGKFIYVINTRTDEIIEQVYAGNAPVKKIYLTTSNQLMSWNADGSVFVWNLSLGQIVVPMQTWFKAGVYSDAVFSQNGRWMVTGNTGNWARVWNI